MNFSLVSGARDSIDEVLGTDRESLSCAIEVRDLAPNITEQFLTMFFESRKRSGGDKIEDVFYCSDERRAVITFAHTEGCIAH